MKNTLVLLVLVTPCLSGATGLNANICPDGYSFYQFARMAVALCDQTKQ
jgi:hypothetical protein